MPKQIGLVTQNLPQGLTEVLTERKGACGGCQPTHGCSTCLTSSKMKARVLNPVGANPGDVVEIHMDNRAIYYSAIILYGLPLIGLFAGAVLGAGVGNRWFENVSLSAALFGLGGIGLGFFMAMMIGNSAYARQHFTPTITQVVTPVIPTDTALPGGGLTEKGN